jgi:hypothetical protein
VPRGRSSAGSGRRKVLPNPEYRQGFSGLSSGPAASDAINSFDDWR